MTKAAKKKAPSRVRYEEAHPTVSCRISKEVYDELQEVKESEGKSFADILKIGLGIIEARMKEEGEVRKKVYADGRKERYAEAEGLYRVTYHCSICRKMIELTSKKAKQAASEYMQEHDWGHKACHQKKR